MNKPIVAALTLLSLSWGAVTHAFECNECHSKNPKMVAMHTALRGENCFGCHKVGEKLMGKGQPKDRESLLKRRISDPLCLRCHGKKE
jgi:hypothetical protein